MKKIVVLVCLVIMAGFYNQSLAQAQVALGIKGGLNFAKLDVSDAGTAFDSRTGYHAGAFVLFKLSKIGVQPELLFSKQGTKFQGNTQDLEANFDYINIPVILKIYTVGGINLQLGPQFGFLTTAEIQDDSGGSLTTADVKELYKGSDVSIALGLGWDAPFGLSLDARYNLGVTEIEDNAALGSTKNQVFQISAGFKLLKFGK